MTRAKKSINLFGNIKSDKNIIQSGTLLEQLKPCFNESWIQEAPILDKAEIETVPKIDRLHNDWQSPININMPSDNNAISFKLTNNQASIIGTIVHHILRQISESNLNDWNKKHLNNQHLYWQKLLKQAGYLNIEQGLKLINKAIILTLKDKQGRWILSPHKEAASELASTTNFNNKIEHYIIDRTFVDKENARWIIDYKTSVPDQESIEIFLNREKEKYSVQLFQYAKAIHALDPTRKIKLGLYFPLFSGWVEIDNN